ncbi:hypothetical protein OIY81_3088, partial [Cryptosporidium canis]
VFHLAYSEFRGREWRRHDAGPGYDLGFEGACGRSSVLHPSYSEGGRDGTQLRPREGGGCVCCGSSWAGGSNLGEGGSFHAQGRRVHSYYEQCLSEDSDSSSCGGEQEYLPEGQSPDGHSDISDDMEIVIKRNNRNVISLALNWISLSGEHNKRIRKFVADSLDSVDLKNVPHFVILFQYDDHKGIRGLYSYFQEEKEWQR